MRLADSFKQNETRTLATAAVAVAAVACAGCAVMAVRQAQMSTRVAELERVAEMNATVTLRLTHAVGQLVGVRSENPIT